MKLCSSCKVYKEETEFYWKDKAHTVLNSKCKVCSNAHMSELRRERYQLIQDYKSKHGCAICGEKRHWVLDLHHKNGNKKERAISDMLRKNMSWETIEQELQKCEVYCANCHRDYHYNNTRVV